MENKTDTPKLWRDMTDAEKGALLLAHHEGRVIERYRHGNGWVLSSYPSWWNDRAYRVRPEPKRETVTAYGGKLSSWCFDRAGPVDDTHRITFDLINGKPDCASIRMEPVE